MRGYNNIMIRSMWRIVEVTLSTMMYHRLIDLQTYDALMLGRSHMGFQMMVVTNNDTLRTNYSNKQVLEARESLLHRSRESNTILESTNRLFTHTGCSVHGCLISAILHVMKIQPLYTKTSTAMRCDHKRYPCIVFHNNQVNDVCLQCGMDSPCSVLIDIGARYVMFEGEQAVCPSQFLDPACELPGIIVDHLTHFTHKRLVRSYGNNGATLRLDKNVSHCRRHVVWSTLVCDARTYMISMVMPTLNYCTYRISCDSIVPGNVEESIVCVKFMLYNIRPFNRYELRVQKDEMLTQYISITGTLAHWYMGRYTNVQSPIIVSCSMGSSVIQLHRIGTQPGRISVDRLAMSTSLLYELTALIEPSDQCIVSRERKKVIFRFPRPGRVDQGTSLTLGCNGGFQWVGNPRDLSRSLQIFAAIVDRNTNRPEFMEAMSVLQFDRNPVYPSGISRAAVMH